MVLVLEVIFVFAAAEMRNQRNCLSWMKEWVLRCVINPDLEVRLQRPLLYLQQRLGQDNHISNILDYSTVHKNSTSSSAALLSEFLRQW
jgi:lipopolysaccharide/colanic/teichoic acid biosynthesis glycosyltransferase